MIELCERVEVMPDEDQVTGREIGTYRLYKDTMQRIVEIAAHRGVSVADLCDPLLIALGDAEYMDTLNAKMEAERERQKTLAQIREKKKKG